MKYGRSVLLKVCQSMKRKDEVFSWAVDEMQGQRDEQNATAVAAVLGIPLLLKEKIKSFLLFADESNEDPQASSYIRGNGATYGESTCFTIFVDGEEVGSCSLLIADLSSYIASFYVFDLAYPTI
ncbi:uncharacterized protein [Apostichopus japonicus]|uniref:uncharacterized protein n=1 Tax=Stichopus japonicus TaxID=307972 RepID=UPI003AB4D2C7